MPGYVFVPGRGILGESCDLPTSACSNEYRDIPKANEIRRGLPQSADSKPGSQLEHARVNPVLPLAVAPTALVVTLFTLDPWTQGHSVGAALSGMWLLPSQMVPQHRDFFATGTPESVPDLAESRQIGLAVIPPSRTKNRPEQG